ncbi:MAG TPA: type II toxin-antitoxin system VapC family toxin [Roseiarcus sp.]|nr:type II toxin-antitoxin system VapC family toxin [Roseiarcus sp.]
MIVIDTSALIAILDREPERTAFYQAIAAADRRLVSAVSYQEAGRVLIAKRGVKGLYDLEDFLGLIGAEIVPHDVDLAALALEAFRRYGKGIDPKARLNFCDRATYALAKATRAPLLFKGDDFSQTDIELCL